MPVLQLRATRRVAAPAPVAYGLLADYTDGHQRVVPPKAIRNLVVEEGGIGAGTRIRFDHVLLGMTRTMRATVTEPEPGRVLAERDVASGITTQFIVDPRGDACDVTIATDVPVRGGVLGALERALVRRFLLPLYEEELARLAQVATEGQRAA